MRGERGDWERDSIYVCGEDVELAGRFTEKKMENRRFRRTEEKILLTVYRGKELVSVSRLIRKLGISRATFFYHHKSEREIVSDYRDYVLRKFRRSMRRFLKGGEADTRSLMLRMLVFIMSNREIFLMFRRAGEKEVWEKMIGAIREPVLRLGGLPEERAGKIYRIYAGEMMAVLDGWGAERFSKGMMDETLGEMVYLTETIKMRLGVLQERKTGAKKKA